jgi:hypothetical protein
MLKIDTSSPNGVDLVVSLAGWIRREHLPELEHLVERATAAGGAISLDLQRVSLVDREAVDFLAAGAGRQAEIRDCPTYLRAWLQSVGRELR